MGLLLCAVLEPKIFVWVGSCGHVGARGRGDNLFLFLGVSTAVKRGCCRCDPNPDRWNFSTHSCHHAANSAS